MWERPEDDVTKELILHDGDTMHQELLRRIIRSWKMMHTKGSELGTKNATTKESYTQWVKKMVQQVKLPFVIDHTYRLDMPYTIHVSIEEVENLKAIVTRIEREQENLEHNLYDVSYEKNKLKFDLGKREKQLGESEENVELERGKRHKTLGGLFSTRVNLESLNQQLKDARVES